MLTLFSDPWVRTLTYVAGFALCVTYALLQWPLIFTPASVYDERWFLGIVEEHAKTLALENFPTFVITQTNELGYGSLYWVVYTVLVKIFSGFNTELIFSAGRILSYLFIVAVPAAFWLYGLVQKSPYRAFCALCLWLCMPVAWWYVKITAPEPFLILSSLVGLFLIVSTRSGLRLLGWLLYGLMVGLKISTLPVVLFAYLYTTLRGKNFKTAYLFSLGLGFVFANPFVLVHPLSYFSELNAVTDSQHTPTLEHLGTIISSQELAWEMFLIGGFTEWGLPLLSLAAFLGMLLCTSPYVLRALFTTFLSAFGLFLLNDTFFGWYWFPLLPLFPFILFYIIPEQRKILFSFCGGLFVSTVILSQVPLIIQSYESRSVHADHYEQRISAQRCLDDFALTHPVDLVVDWSEINHILASSNLVAPYPDDNMPIEGEWVLFLVGPRVATYPHYQHTLNAFESSSVFRQRVLTYNLVSSSTCSFLKMYYIKKAS